MTICPSKELMQYGHDFCPCCHQNRAVEFGGWLCSYVLKKAPYRHFLFGIPKIPGCNFIMTKIFFPI